jgi:hypothetical protein
MSVSFRPSGSVVPWSRSFEPDVLPEETVGPPPEIALRPADGLTATRTGPLFRFQPGINRWMERWFAPGAATRLTGPPAWTVHLTSYLLAAAAAAGRVVSLREGANRFEPYTIARIGRRWATPTEDLLDRIRVARAFTAHQMVTLAETWADDEAVAPEAADLLVAGDPAAPFASEEEVEPYERTALLPHLARCLKRLLTATHRPLLLVEYTGGLGLPDDRDGLPIHETIRLQPRAATGGARLLAVRAGETLELLPLAAHQRHLEEFDGLPEGLSGGGFDRWDAPFPRTAMP